MDEYGKSEYGFDDLKADPSPIEKRKGFPGWAIALIVAGVVVVLIGGVVLMGVVFLWSSSFTEVVNENVNNFILDGEIDGTEDTLTLTVLSGTVDWSDYSVTADGATLTTTSTSSVAGQDAIFTGVGWDPKPGTLYNIKMIEIDGNRIVSDMDITAINGISGSHGPKTKIVNNIHGVRFFFSSL
ncbi:MAG: hypothetical protein U9R75_10875 [Candidatus Thermoplasmatota archaeon]|nr:hypothetical protein [Candidatus Thermoplasmatota archaeon]